MKEHKGEIRSKIGSAIATLILVAAVGLCLLVVSQVQSKGYVSVVGHSLFRVITGSMEPTIPVDALLISAETDIEDLKEGDIICFRSRETGMLGRVITHRIVDIHKDVNGNCLLVTRGDANMVHDNYYVTKDNLIGRVIWHTKDGNPMAAIVSVATSKIGFLACVVFPVLLVGGLILKDCVKSIQNELNNVERELNLEKQAEKQVEITADEKTPGEFALDPEEYEEMRSRLRAELIEELEQSVKEDVER